jgi:hypothetical protein
VYPKGLEVDPDSPEFTREELLANTLLIKGDASTVRESEGVAAFSAGELAAAGAFDFGDVPEFDYGAL